jgi:fluoroquinolone transport system ATP-binding protein
VNPGPKPHAAEPRAGGGIIEVEALVYSYPGAEAPALKGVSFTVARAEIFGFLGPSGAGKSTTQRVLIGILKGYEGEVRVRGRDLRREGPGYYEHIGVGFELPNHFMKLTAVENLRFFASFYNKSTREPRELLAMLGLGEHADKRVDQLSKGMKMRLNFARSLLHDPEILFLDEPTAGLDPMNARVLKDIIVEQKGRGKSIFLTTHNMHDAEELCDRVAFIADGEIKLIDTPRKLRAERARRRVTVEYLEGGQLRSRELPLDDLGWNQGFLELLREREIVSLHSQEPSLEELFIQATGRKLT